MAVGVSEQQFVTIYSVHKEWSLVSQNNSLYLCTLFTRSGRWCLRTTVCNYILCSQGLVVGVSEQQFVTIYSVHKEWSLVSQNNSLYLCTLFTRSGGRWCLRTTVCNYILCSQGVVVGVSEQQFVTIYSVHKEWPLMSQDNSL